MEVLWGLPSGNFQPSLRDFPSLEFLPRTASWAKVSRPCGTHCAIGSYPLALATEVRLWPVPNFFKALRLVFQQALGIHPFEKERWPIGHGRRICFANPKAMPYPSINMELGGNMETAQSKIEFGQALRDIRPVVASAGQKGARRLCGEPGFMGNGRIQKRLEVWLRTRPLHRIF